MTNGHGWRAWALGIAVTIAGTLSMFMWTSLSAKVEEQSKQISERNERITRTETEMEQVKRVLERMDSKLDRLLDRERARVEPRR